MGFAGRNEERVRRTGEYIGTSDEESDCEDRQKGEQLPFSTV